MDLSCSSESYSILQSEELSEMPVRLYHRDLLSSIPFMRIDIPQCISRLASYTHHCLLPPTNSSVLWTRFLFILSLQRLLPLTLHPSVAGLPSSPFCLADSNSYLMSCLRYPCIWEAFSGLDFSSPALLQWTGSKRCLLLVPVSLHKQFTLRLASFLVHCGAKQAPEKCSCRMRDQFVN